MRWKLQFLASLAMSVAAVLLCVVAYRILSGGFTVGDPWSGRARLVLPLVLVPALAGGFFVYRHSPRRRKTQALITIVLTLFFSACGLLALLRFA
jgi:hypothetical protein